MGIWPSNGTAPALVSSEGELVLLHISVEPRLLEDLLEILARLDFPVNPELHHQANSVTIEFPAWSGRVDDVRSVLRLYGFDPSCLGVEHALATHS